MDCAVLVSGGVDSSVALTLLQEQGYSVTAFYIKIWLEDELSFLGSCPWQEDLAFVTQLCAQRSIPLEIISLQKEYHDIIITATINSVKNGYTPNPDIMCNQHIKFGAFLDKISPSFVSVASGHYGRVIHEETRSRLFVSPDPIKDQTYFLSQLSKEQLKKLVLPLGSYTKYEIREKAHRYNLATCNRKDSQGLCFLGKIRFSDFIHHHLGKKQGPLIEWETGMVYGVHDGHWFYTIGQRKAIRLSGGPWYVVAKDVIHNTVYISRTYYTSDKDRTSFYVGSLSWFTKPPADVLKIKLRHGPHYHEGSFEPIDSCHGRVRLIKNDQGIAAGQYAVFYHNNECLGSGIILPHSPLLSTHEVVRP